MTKSSISPELQKISQFLETIESLTDDKQTARQIREFMTKEDLWIFPTPANDPIKFPRTPAITEQIVYNAVKCLVCEKTVESRHVHDYQVCGCKNEAMVDGGHAYARFGAADMTKIVKYTYVSTDPHDLIREFVSWGSYGKNGDQPLQYKLIKDMSDDHLRAVIVWPRGAQWMKDLMKQEIDYREEFNISITD